MGHQLPIAVADTTTFPGSDYYEIEEGEYTHQFNTDLPATHLRGYRQINATGASNTYQYLGPIIVAQKNHPVRIKLVNNLSPGNTLPIPVDTTYMGADKASDTDNRTSMHLHGGNTPWISDGTARQWVKPAGEPLAPNKGESARNVPDMWFDASGKVVPAGDSRLANPVANGLSNDPGKGALTFFYTNEQSARLMFYHDHAEGTTRLNVYDGMAAGYVLTDPTEQAMVYDAANNSNGILPPLADTIPLVIQEKTFVPDKTQPVLNFYGPFKSQLESQDPTWRWGTSSAATTYNGNGDLWVPHVFMPNQNPGDVSGANAVGRWDYGPWFWPPFVNIQNGEIANPYYDAACITTTQYCENQFIPGVPNGSTIAASGQTQPGVLDNATGQYTSSPSGTPEAFNDTAMVNGTAYPYINVDPKKYRLRMLSVGDDRMLNLSLVLAASKYSVDANGNVGTAAGANVGTANNSVPCDGTTTYPSTYPSNLAGTVPVQADCTEVKMVPWDAAQDAVTHFPAWWYTKQKAGVTFDGRPSGVFDPATRGPEMVQIGTEGGFLAAPVEIKNQPVNYEYNPKNILIGNVKEKALFLGPAERADVVVDFSQFAGSTLILYNDAPAPNPAWDLRLDYYTGDFDNTDTGGTFSTIPGYGPNSRTLLQIRVAPTCTTANCGVAPLNRTEASSHTVDDVDAEHLALLTTAVRTAFKTSQEPIIVPQSVYGPTYGTSFVDALGADLSRISDNWLTYTPLDPATRLLSTTDTIKLELEPKSIIEDWTQNWGRMNALLGTEVPHTTATIQTSIPQAFVDPPTDLVKITPNDNMVPISGTAPDGTQLWKITHNGVDSHAIHFHLFHVQIVNRVGWDGAIYAPDANELGWKDTVRMNPLSDTIVALRPMTMTALPFKTPNSHRLINPAPNANVADFFNLDPTTGNASTVNTQYTQSVNYGWEYLWHCHILGHEENDMMRTIAVAQPPEAPINLTATTTGTGRNQRVRLDWKDNYVISNWVTIQRSTTSNFTAGTITEVNVVRQECAVQAGCGRTYTDNPPVNSSVYYRIMANNTVGAGDGKLDAPRNPDGSYGGMLPAGLSSLVPGFTGYANVTANSNWSNTVSRLYLPYATLTPNPLTFPGTTVGSTSAAQLVTLSNTGTATMTVNKAMAFTGLFARSGGTCTTTGGGTTFTLLANASCTVGVTFTPLATGAATGSLVITDNSGGTTGSLVITDNSGGTTGSTQTVSLSGNGLPFTMTANPDTATATANTSTTQALTAVNVRANDSPANTGNVAIVGSVAKSGNPVPTATALASVNGNNIVLTLTGAGNNGTARQASKRGVYTVTYSVTANGVTSQSTLTITVK